MESGVRQEEKDLMENFGVACLESRPKGFSEEICSSGVPGGLGNSSPRETKGISYDSSYSC